MNYTSTICSLTLFLLIFIFSFSSPTYADEHHDFLECLTKEYRSIYPNDVVHTPTNSSFLSILRSPIKNLRFALETTPQPQAIITPQHESQIPPVICCAKASKLEIRTRSGGHDFEGLSSVSQLPFLIIDLINLSEITIDVEDKTAWVGSGSTIGSLYYKIAEKSPVLGFPAGLCPTVGVGGHLSGGGYGTLLRKYGLAADNVVDARIIDVHGRILDRKSMGEDLFWAIRGGGGGSFGVIVAWKVQLVDVPETVTVSTVSRTLDENVTGLIHRWQYVAPKMDKDLFLAVIVLRMNNTTVVSFFSLFLGGVERLMSLMQESFPELGLEREDCIETSWIKSTVYFASFPLETPVEILLNRTSSSVANIKMKSNYVQKPMTESGLEGVWRYIDEAGPGADDVLMRLVFMVPYGGRMAEISESAVPFPHRGDRLYMIAHQIVWGENEAQNSERYISWSRRLYDYLTPYVASNPRFAYANYRDLDLGVNNVVRKKTSYAQASVWGKKYFNNNFDRLVKVKTMVDPHNFFRNEQTIPPVSNKGN